MGACACGSMTGTCWLRRGRRSICCQWTSGGRSSLVRLRVLVCSQQAGCRLLWHHRGLVALPSPRDSLWGLLAVVLLLLRQRLC